MCWRRSDSRCLFFVVKAKDPRIGAATDPKRDTTNISSSLCVCATSNAGVLQLRFRMTVKNKQRQRQYSDTLLISQRKMFIQSIDTPIDLLFRNDQRGCDDEVAYPGLDRNAVGEHLARNLIDQKRRT